MALHQWRNQRVCASFFLTRAHNLFIDCHLSVGDVLETLEGSLAHRWYTKERTIAIGKYIYSTEENAETRYKRRRERLERAHWNATKSHTRSKLLRALRVRLIHFSWWYSLSDTRLRRLDGQQEVSGDGTSYSAPLGDASGRASDRRRYCDYRRIVSGVHSSWHTCVAQSGRLTLFISRHGDVPWPGERALMRKTLTYDSPDRHAFARIFGDPGRSTLAARTLTELSLRSPPMTRLGRRVRFIAGAHASPCIVELHLSIATRVARLVPRDDGPRASVRASHEPAAAPSRPLFRPASPTGTMAKSRGQLALPSPPLEPLVLYGFREMRKGSAGVYREEAQSRQMCRSRDASIKRGGCADLPGDLRSSIGVALSFRDDPCPGMRMRYNFPECILRTSANSLATCALSAFEPHAFPFLWI